MALSDNHEEFSRSSVTVLDSNKTSMLLQIDGRLVFKPNNEITRLRFLHGLHEFLSQPMQSRYLGDDILISSTYNENVFTIEWDGDLVQNPPSLAENVLKALLDAIERKDTDPIKALFCRIKELRIREETIEAIVHTVPPHRIKYQKDSIIIDDLFRLEKNGHAYRCDNNRHLCIVPGNRTIKPMVIRYRNFDISLSETDVLFLSKLFFLLAAERYRNDSGFWHQVADLFEVGRKTNDYT